MAYSSCCYCNNACYSLLIIRVLCEITFLVLLSFFNCLFKRYEEFNR